MFTPFRNTNKTSFLTSFVFVFLDSLSHNGNKDAERYHFCSFVLFKIKKPSPLSLFVLIFGSNVFDKLYQTSFMTKVLSQNF